MRKIILISLVVAGTALTMFLLLSRDGAPITNFPPKSGLIVVLGDSLVEGVGATSGGDFPSVLEELAREPIINMGKAGDTSRNGLDRIEEILALNPKVALVLLGGNDFLRRVPKAETFANIDEIVEKLQGSGAIVIILGVQGGIFSDGYKNEFKKIAEDRGALYVPNVLKGVIGQGELMDDAIHPNDAGYKKIAEKIYPVLRRALGK
jgi:acyl-CoA thioesterase I